MSKLIELKFRQESGRYISDLLQLKGDKAVVMIKGTLSFSLERSLDSANWSAVKDSNVDVVGIEEITVTDAVEGMFIRVVATAKPVLCKALV